MNKNEVDINEYPHFDPDYHSWSAFETFAEQQGIGDDKGDWWDWWVCWCSAYNIAISGG